MGNNRIKETLMIMNSAKCLGNKYMIPISDITDKILVILTRATTFFEVSVIKDDLRCLQKNIK